MGDKANFKALGVKNAGFRASVGRWCPDSERLRRQLSMPWLRGVLLVAQHHSGLKERKKWRGDAYGTR